MKPIIIPESYNYIGIFLTMRCNLKCSYCINQFNNKKIIGTELSGDEWITGLSRIVTRPDLPLSFQGGEPTLHKEFYKTVLGMHDRKYRIDNDRNILATEMDLMTNLQFNIYDFMYMVAPTYFKRPAPYASIRVSYHPTQQNGEELLHKVKVMQDRGYSIGIWSVDHPEKSVQNAIAVMRDKCEAHGIDFRLKEYLGYYNGKLYGKYKYSSAITKFRKRAVQCKTTELLIGPDGHIYRCHADLYAQRTPIGHILDESFEINDTYRECSEYGYCNPCDVKIKNNRFQQMGHTSVSIKEI